MRRECGDCQLCCRLLPMSDNEPWRDGPPIKKPANVRCPYQKHGVGCSIYDKRPFCCEVWTCRWLINDDMDDQSRPDRSHLVVDVMPDYVTIQTEGEPDQKIEVVQVWCDPRYPDAHRNPTFRRYVARLGEKGILTIIRYNSHDCLTIFPPALMDSGKFHEFTGGMAVQRSQKEIVEFLAGARIEIEL